MDVAGPLIGGGVSLIGAIMNANAQKQQRDIDWMGLQETKRGNRKSEELARSTRTDPYGNKLIYKPGVGWTYDLTGITEQILSAEQGEKRRNLLEDAPRERAASVRRDNRSISADKDFERLSNEYRYRPKHSEAEEINDSTDLLLKSRKKGLDEAASVLARQLLRTGQGSNLEGLYKSTGNQYADSLEEAMMKGRSMGKDAFRSRRDSDDAAARGELDYYRQIAEQGGGTPAQNSGFNGDLSGRADSAQAALLQAIQNGTASNAQAYGNAARSAGGGGIDLSGLAQSLSRLNFDDSKDEEQYPIPPGDEYFKHHTDGLW